MDGFPQGPQWAPGTVVGSYQVIEHVASGGMAEVYAAIPRGGGEPVVLKAMSRTLLANEEFVRLFLDEAQLIATLNHPNIGRIFDRGEHRGTHYFVMEYVLGPSCREVLNRAVRDPLGHIPLPHAIDISCDIAAALHYAHERCSVNGRNYGIVHRDVSHSNVLVTYPGAAKLIDFGVAKSSMRSTETKVGSLKGKVRYMSPEQIRGEAIDRRSDLFALGIMLWEMTTGQRLFRAPNEAATMHKILFEEVRRPSDAMEGYPPDLEQIVMTMLARRPTDRPATAEEVRRQLTEFASRAGLPRGGVASYLRRLFGDEVNQAIARYQELRQHLPAPRQAVAAPRPAVTAVPTSPAPSAPPMNRALHPTAPTLMPAAVAASVPAPAPAPFAASDPKSATRSRSQRHVTRERTTLLLFVVLVAGVILAGLLLAHRTRPAPGRARDGSATESQGFPHDRRGVRQ